MFLNGLAYKLGQTAGLETKRWKHNLFSHLKHCFAQTCTYVYRRLILSYVSVANSSLRLYSFMCVYAQTQARQLIRMVDGVDAPIGRTSYSSLVSSLSPLFLQLQSSLSLLYSALHQNVVVPVYPGFETLPANFYFYCLVKLISRALDVFKMVYPLYKSTFYLFFYFSPASSQATRNGSSRWAYVLLWFFLWHLAALYLRDGSGDRPETFTHDWKCAHLDFGG